MSAISVLNSRQLALRLAALDQLERQELLADLPLKKQQELQQLIEEIEPANAERSAFELAMAEIEMSDSSGEVSWDESRLQLALAGEAFAIKQQLVDVFIRRKKSLVTVHVHSVITNYLHSKNATLPTPVIVAKPWWKVWG